MRKGSVKKEKNAVCGIIPKKELGKNLGGIRRLLRTLAKALKEGKKARLTRITVRIFEIRYILIQENRWEKEWKNEDYLKACPPRSCRRRVVKPVRCDQRRERGRKGEDLGGGLAAYSSSLLGLNSGEANERSGGKKGDRWGGQVDF